MIRNPLKGLITPWFDEDDPYEDYVACADFLID